MINDRDRDCDLLIILFETASSFETDTQTNIPHTDTDAETSRPTMIPRFPDRDWDIWYIFETDTQTNISHTDTDAETSRPIITTWIPRPRLRHMIHFRDRYPNQDFLCQYRDFHDKTENQSRDRDFPTPTPRLTQWYLHDRDWVHFLSKIQENPSCYIENHVTKSAS